MDEPVCFIFSHSALREGWDNPNVFVICALKHSDNTVTRRQEVGRGMHPDWAIAFKQDSVKHIYFIAETKGDMSSIQLRKIEESKIECARKFFAKNTNEEVRYEVVDGYGKLMELVK